MLLQKIQTRQRGPIDLQFTRDFWPSQILPTRIPNYRECPILLCPDRYSRHPFLLNFLQDCHSFIIHFDLFSI